MKMRSSSEKKPDNHIKRSNPKFTVAMAAVPRSSNFIHRKVSTVTGIFSNLCVFALLGVSSNKWFAFSSSDPLVKYYSVEIVNEYPHDPEAYTQGLLYSGNNTLFESTGLYSKSSVRKVALQTGKVEVIHNMSYNYFGEGLALLDERHGIFNSAIRLPKMCPLPIHRLFQLTWLKKTGFIYDQNDLGKFEMFTHQMQDGWGLATDRKFLFGSDGTSTLYRIDPQTMKVIDRQIIKFGSQEVNNLNELEYINREVWANVYETDCIAIISYADGRVVGWILLENLREGLIAAGNKGIDVLNGIAWDEGKNRFFVTGKLWPKLYEIKLNPKTEGVNDELIDRLCLPKPFH